ncbi:MAG TPA: flavodoxin domain-containing protein [Symbiobacteriaceae bacterium]|nr:flavodoxin domain-containing protein [Symbiobacteriaceae bacterium]
MAEKSMTRRDFLKVAGLTVGTVALASGIGCAALGDSAAKDAEPETPDFTFGEDQTMSKRILVTYATRTGSTVGVAAAIGETLGSRGFAVDVKPVKENPRTDGYDAIIMGSAINGGQWLPEAVEFVKNNRKALNRVPLVLYCVHIMNLGDDEKSKQKRHAYLDAVRPLVGPVDEVWFAGLGSDPSKDSWLARWVYRTFNIGPEGDCRDWARIRGWAQTVPVA